MPSPDPSIRTPESPARTPGVPETPELPAAWKPIIVSATPEIPKGPLSVAPPLSISSGSVIPTPGDVGVCTPGSLATLLSSVESPNSIRTHEDGDLEVSDAGQEVHSEDTSESSVSVPCSSDSTESRDGGTIETTQVTLVQRVRDVFGSALGLKKKSTMSESGLTESTTTEPKTTNDPARKNESGYRNSGSDDKNGSQQKGKRKRRRKPAGGRPSSPRDRQQEGRPYRGNKTSTAHGIKSVPTAASSVGPTDFASPDLATSARMTTAPSVAPSKRAQRRSQRRQASEQHRVPSQKGRDYNPFVAAVSFADDVRREVAVRARLSGADLLAPPSLARRGHVVTPQSTTAESTATRTMFTSTASIDQSSVDSITPDDVLLTPSPIPLEVQWADDDNEDLLISRNPAQAFVDIMELILGSRPVPYDLTPRSV